MSQFPIENLNVNQGDSVFETVYITNKLFYDFDEDNITIFSDTDSNSLLFPFPYSPIKTFPNNITYKFKRFHRCV